MRYHSYQFAFLGMLALLASPAHADSSLNYRLNSEGTVQPVLVREGKVLIQSVDNGNRKDLLFDRSRGEAILIDHTKQTFITVNDHSIERLSRQSEPLQPLLAGLGAQLSKLTTEQRAKWQQMLGGVDLQKIADAAKSVSPTHLTKNESARKVGSFSCEPVTIIRGKKKVAEVCLSPASTVGLPSDDYATLRSLLDFAQHVASKTQGFSSLLGISIPVIAVQDMPGIPVEIRDLSGKLPGTLSLAGIDLAGLGAVPMDVPPSYQNEELKLW